MKALGSTRAAAVRVAVIVVAMAIVAGTLTAVLSFRSGQDATTSPRRDRAAPSVDRGPAPAPAATQPSGGPGVPAGADPAAYQIGRLRALGPIAPGPATATIPGETAKQPDLYAAEFVRRLLTQHYRAPRTPHLQWVQAESAQTLEPLVVGLIPTERRDRYALFSVTDATDSPAPVPTERQWQGLGLRHTHTTVAIDRSEEPRAWTKAVASGWITDPRITGRDVATTVVRHTSVEGKPHRDVQRRALAQPRGPTQTAPVGLRRRHLPHRDASPCCRPAQPPGSSSASPARPSRSPPPGCPYVPSLRSE